MKRLSVSFTAKCKKLTILLDIKSGMLLVPIPTVKVQFSFTFSRNRDLSNSKIQSSVGGSPRRDHKSHLLDIS